MNNSVIQLYKNTLQYKNCIESNNNLILGPKNSGKSTLIYHLVYNQIKINKVNYSDIFIFCNSSSIIWKSNLPFVNYCNIMDIEKVKNDILHKNNSTKKIVIFEDCINLIDTNSFISILDLQTYCTTTYISSSTTEINLNISSKFDNCFVLKYYQYLDMINIFNKFIHSEILNSYNSFKSLLDKCTHIPYNSLVIKNSFFSQEFYQFKVDILDSLFDDTNYWNEKNYFSNTISSPINIKNNFMNIKSKLFDNEIFPKSNYNFSENDLDDIEKGFYKKLLDYDEKNKDEYDEIEDDEIEDDETEDDELNEIDLEDDDDDFNINHKLPEYSDPIFPEEKELKILNFDNNHESENINNPE